MAALTALHIEAMPLLEKKKKRISAAVVSSMCELLPSLHGGRKRGEKGKFGHAAGLTECLAGGLKFM